MTIQKISISHLDQLQKVGRQTFYETFSKSNTEENMRKYLEEGFSKEKLESEINNPGSAFYFAQENDEVLGYLKLNTGKSQTEIKDEKALEIERIYVLKAFQGKHIGQLLYEKAIEVAKEINADYVWLGVWEENSKAIGFYNRNGFVEFDKHIFKLGDEEQTDIMMKLKLKTD